MSGLAPFAKPLVIINKTGFGPTTLPEFDFPYQPFWKDERVGKVVNFGGYQLGQNTRFAGSGSSSNNAHIARLDSSDKSSFFGHQAFLAASSASHHHHHSNNNGEEEYELVETLKNLDSNRGQPKWNLNKPGGGGGGNQAKRSGPGGKVMQTERGEPIADLNQPLLKGKQAKFLMQGVKRGKQWNQSGKGQNNRRRDFFSDRELANKEGAVKIRTNWELIDSIDLPQFGKMMVDKLPTVKELQRCGDVRRYDEAADRINTKSAKPLKLNADTAFVYPGCLEDPIMEQLITENQGTVYATDEVLAYLMCAPRSLKTWDLVLIRVGNVLFIDKRQDAALEVLTVNETFTDRVLEKDEPRLKFAVNSPDRLGLEATAINQSLMCQLVGSGETPPTLLPNPFTAEDGQKHQPIQYVYKSFQIEGGHNVVVRTEVHAVNKLEKAINLYALNEFDSKLTGNVDWRQKLDNQTGSVVANELKNNAPKVARWTCQALMSNADQMKIGFVSRTNSEDASKHTLLAVNTFKPRDLAVQINLREKNMWGIVRHICDLVMNKEEGKYLLVRDPNKAIMRLYNIPMSTFEEESEDEDEEDDDEGLGHGDEDEDDEEEED
ncbi:hypothetical protein BASA81_012837 [Batrachochytrium salamandrivorans]|nr:hypothetical protein BASA81_012837 [Batrachochytrium salamandrivorans]